MKNRTAFAVVILAALSPELAAAQEVTWAGDVAQVFYDNCVECHQPEGIGPFSLLDYQSARRYASRIGVQVATRQMPPWHIDRDVGVQRFKNDVSLSEEEISSVVQWVEGGALEGDPAEAPPTPELPSGAEWRLAAQFGPPDLIVRSTPFDVPASGHQHERKSPTRFIRAGVIALKRSFGLTLIIFGSGIAVRYDGCLREYLISSLSASSSDSHK